MNDLDNEPIFVTDSDKRMKDLGKKPTVWADFDKKMNDLDNEQILLTDFDKTKVWTDIWFGNSIRGGSKI